MACLYANDVVLFADYERNLWDENYFSRVSVFYFSAYDCSEGV